VRADDQHARLGRAPTDLARREDAVHAGHRDVHQDDVGPEGVDNPEGAARRTGFADDLVARGVCEDVAYAHPKQGVIIDEDDSHGGKAPGSRGVVAIYIRAARQLFPYPPRSVIDLHSCYF